MNIESVIKAYDRYSRFYDILFGMFFFQGRKDVINKIKFNDNDRLLEVGIGTGASVSLYPNQIEVVGVDLSEKMLKICERRIGKLKKSNIQVVNMNAESLDFPDESFEHVIAMYVVSVSPNPNKVVSELIRACKKGGNIIILNHFSHESSILTFIEKVISPLSSLIGFTPYFPLNKFLKENPLLDVYEIEKTNLFGYWTIIRARKSGN